MPEEANLVNDCEVHGGAVLDINSESNCEVMGGADLEIDFELTGDESDAEVGDFGSDFVLIGGGALESDVDLEHDSVLTGDSALESDADVGDLGSDFVLTALESDVVLIWC